jgi:hypothetical protein
MGRDPHTWEVRADRVRPQVATGWLQGGTSRGCVDGRSAQDALPGSSEAVSRSVATRSSLCTVQDLVCRDPKQLNEAYIPSLLEVLGPSTCVVTLRFRGLGGVGGMKGC